MKTKIIGNLDHVGRNFISGKFYKKKYKDSKNLYLKPEDFLGTVIYLLKINKGCVFYLF